MSVSTVLVPLDGSALSRESVDMICRLLDPQRYQVMLLRVAAPPPGVIAEPERVLPIVGWGVPEYRTARQFEVSQHPIYPIQAEASLAAELEAEVLDDARCLIEAGFHVHPQVRFGEPAKEIVACAHEINAALIALTTHGRTGLRRLLLGSVAEQVLRTSTVPVVLIRPFVDAS